ncbi:hypothetical protein PghCCS26_62740 [Paenibacillus glycanilyticus]|uniref:Primase C-terminal 1 domain-containing protein n=1 Tax=Paenibacillus glycanilyticus TaxID=126569 RepID=A0ABQ6NX75_9BACL|nr:hypothetical protein [Paenibacillus glycanilyticus]GMK49144.1 hypothetical protein PghCCS26_62740 [Paenibacillus glycanilyticus]
MEYLMAEPTAPDLLFNGLPGLIEVREIDANGGAKSRYFDGLAQFKAYTPPSDKNVYIGMFTRKKVKNEKVRGDKAGCQRTNVLWADYDNTTLNDVRRRIQTVRLPEPSVFVNSGNGIHAYWLLNSSAYEGVEDVLKAIATNTGADVKAAEIARVMRLPGTYNVKGSTPKRCQVIKQSDDRYPIELFQHLFGTSYSSSETIDELVTSKMACIRLIAKGVEKGKRNFALGKITAYTKQQGMSRKKAYGIVMSWNKNNKPMKPANELQDEFNRFWDSDYKYLGCKFTNPDLERINKELCPIGECEFHATQSVQILNDESASLLDNEFFKSTIYPQIKGLHIALYSIVATARTIDRSHLAELMKRHTKDKLFMNAIDELRKLGYIDIEKGNKSRGVAERLTVSAKSNYGRGYTPVSIILTKLYVAKELNDNQYKLLALLKSYSYGKSIVYPTIEKLAVKLGIAERSVTRLLVDLEQQLYIKRTYKPFDNGKTKLIIHLLF